MYYRIAIQAGDEARWQWKSTPLASLGSLFQLLRLYSALPQDHLRVFIASSRQDLDELLALENNGLVTTSVTVEQFLSERGICSFGSKRSGTRSGIQEQSGRRVSTITLPPLVTQSDPAEALPQERSLSGLEKRRWEVEMGVGGDHDQSYAFELPISMPQVLAWTRLLVRVRNGELVP